MHTSRCHFPSQVSAVFFWCVSFLASSKRSETSCVQCDAVRYGAHRSTGFAARFQPIDRGNRELGGHGKAQTLAGDWAVQARSPAGSLVGRVLWRPARRNARECAVYVRVGDGTVCCGRRRQTSNFQRLDARDPGDSRQCFNTGARLSSHVLSARLSVRPSAAVVVVVVEATGHVTDGVQQHSTHSRAHT